MTSTAAGTTRTPLEERYRALVRAYPRAWRARNEEALIGTLLDAADAERRSRPSSGEIVDLAVHAAAARIDEILSARTREAVASISLGAGVAYVLVYVLMHTWAPFSSYASGTTAAHPHLVGLNSGAVLLIVWVGLVASTAAGGRRSRAVCLVAAIAMPSALSVVGMIEPALRSPSTAHLVLLTLLAVQASLARPRRRTAVVASCVVLASLVGVYSASGGLSGGDDRLLWVRVLSPFSAPAVAAIVCSCVVLVQLMATTTHAGRAAMALSSPWVGAWATARTEGVAVELVATAAVLGVAGLVCIAVIRALERSGLALALHIHRVRA